MTVVDPIVAVLMGVFLLGEAAGVPWWIGAGEFVAGAVAIAGVVALASTQVRPHAPAAPRRAVRLDADRAQLDLSALGATTAMPRALAASACRSS